MYHYKTTKKAVEILAEYNKFSKEYSKYVTTLTEDDDENPDCIKFKQQKHTLDQLADDLNRSFKKVSSNVFDKKITNTERKLEQVKVDFMKGMLNNGFLIK